ncbi:hypothetical protein [Hydrocarboniphaga effusa]|jgi:hypothetical protein|uniref:hypothetical protein n=2 Tax=Hydrocarboniphaga effusa TaxID=243629 RepID=UPI003137C04E
MRAGRFATRSLLCWSMLSPIDASLARVQDYQIRRLLSYVSECRVESMGEAGKTADGGLRYQVGCSDLNAYLQGVEVECRDADDERSCRVLTRSQTFDQLHSLDRH